ncbi:hypothetical protein C8R43DRAFT_691671 [Mycena crocata]|nr:hypothetical protein C8R43DRAFT_691671 [Mycena crocata]
MICILRSLFSPSADAKDIHSFLLQLDFHSVKFGIETDPLTGRSLPVRHLCLSIYYRRALVRLATPYSARRVPQSDKRRRSVSVRGSRAGLQDTDCNFRRRRFAYVFNPSPSAYFPTVGPSPCHVSARTTSAPENSHRRPHTGAPREGVVDARVHLHPPQSVPRQVAVERCSSPQIVKRFPESHYCQNQALPQVCNPSRSS